jgi:hypothetical protein
MVRCPGGDHQQNINNSPKGRDHCRKREPTMSYYLALIGTTDSPIYEAELGTYRQGGDGVPKVCVIVFSPLDQN